MDENTTETIEEQRFEGRVRALARRRGHQVQKSRAQSWTMDISRDTG
jgi:hypothetical protein